MTTPAWFESPRSKARLIAVDVFLARCINAVARLIYKRFSTRKQTFVTVVCLAGLGLCISAITGAHAATPASCIPANSQNGFINTTSSNVDGLMASWPQALETAFFPLFSVLLTFGVIVTLVFEIPPTKGDPAAVATVLAKNLFIPVLVSGLFVYSPTLAPSLVNNMIASGRNLTVNGAARPQFTSLQSIKPGDIFLTFSCLGDKIDDETSQSGFTFDLISKPVPTIHAALVQFVGENLIYLDGAIFMIELFLFKIEAMFVIGIGIVLMVGAALPFLYSFPMKYLGALFGLGMKGIALSFMIAISLGEGLNLTGLFGAAPVPPHVVETTAMTLTALAIASWFLPNMLGTLGGSPAVGMGTMIAAAMTMNSVFGAAGSALSQLGPQPKPPDNSAREDQAYNDGFSAGREAGAAGASGASEGGSKDAADSESTPMELTP